MRRRDLSHDERTLWESVAKQARPLRKKRVKQAVSLPLPSGERSTPKAPDEDRAKKKPCTPPLSPAGRGTSRAPAAKPAPPTNLERREKSRLARGIRDIDAKIDLHGMTQARAHRALLSFLQRAQVDGCRYVLVITGKGKLKSEGAERGVLRRQVPEWLALAEFRGLVTGLEEAAIGHGGVGALYVRVRRG